MSWAAYTDVVVAGGAEGAALFGLDGSGKWASSGTIAITDEEGKALAAAMKSPGSAFSTGVKLGGVKHMCITHDEDHIIGKKGQTAILVSKSSKAAIIAIGSCTPQDLMPACDSMATDLAGKGY